MNVFEYSIQHLVEFNLFLGIYEKREICFGKFNDSAKAFDTVKHDFLI